MIPQIAAEKDRIKALYPKLKTIIDDADPWVQHVCSNHLILKSTGFLENSFKVILNEYCRTRSDDRIRKYVTHNAARMNSLNCQKLKNFFDTLDPEFWEKIEESCGDSDLAAVDSVKNIRDKIAHGNHDGTGIITANDYFQGICRFIDCMERTIR